VRRDQQINILVILTSVDIMPHPYNLARGKLGATMITPTLVVLPFCNIREPTTVPRTEPTMTPAPWEWDDDDSLLIVDEDMMEDKADEGNGESVVGVVVGEIMRVEDDDDDDEVEGSADAE
jgi:hypothetical protein